MGDRPLSSSQLTLRISPILIAALALCLPALEARAQQDRAPSRLAFVVGKIVTVDDSDAIINNGVVLVRDGQIEAVGPRREVKIPAGYKTIERTDLWLVPGMIDGHNHTAAPGGGFNDTVYLTNPGLRTLDIIGPGTDAYKTARSGGVTAALFIPGSGSNMGGFGTVLKFAGDTVDESVMRAPGSLKIAQAGNPERYWYGVRRMFMNYNTRQTMNKALKYHQSWEAYETGDNVERPEIDPIFEGFRGLFRHEYPVSVHTQNYQVMMTTVDMLAVKLGVRVMLDHCTFDGYKIAPLVKAADLYTINGPRQFNYDRTQRRIFGHAARWWAGGIRKLGINTDCTGNRGVTQKELSYQAAMACWYGWEPYPALRGVTRIPAEALLIDDEVGSIETGKDADFGLWTGDPIDPRSSCELTVIDGKIVYDAKVKRIF